VPLQIVGSGQGSVSTVALLAELPALAEQVANARCASTPTLSC
jgi:hypothetical protein